MDVTTTDLCIIGAGAAGLAVAEAARAYGASVVIVERDKPGGSWLNTGAVPARALAAAARTVQAIREAPAFGITTGETKVNFRRVHDHVDAVIAQLSPASAAARFAALGVEIVAGEAQFVDRRTLAVGERRLRARRFVVATGAVAEIPAIPGLDAVAYFTTDSILDNTRKLTHLVVIGEGALALEIAQSYRRLGSEVTVVAPAAFLPRLDSELVDVVLARLAEEGVRLLPHSRVAEIRPRSMGIGVVVESGSKELVLDVSHVLVAGDRVPRLDPLGLDKAGARRLRGDPRRLQLTARLKTTNPRIYAVGDAAGLEQSGQSALHQANLVVRDALFGPWLPPDPRHVPALVHTEPAIAQVGFDERAARVRFGNAFHIRRAGFADNDLARTSRQTYGLAKVLIGRDGRLLGASIVGPAAAELISVCGLAVANRMTMRQLARLVAPHPAYAGILTRLAAEESADLARHPLLARWRQFYRLLG